MSNGVKSGQPGQDEFSGVFIAFRRNVPTTTERHVLLKSALFMTRESLQEFMQSNYAASECLFNFGQLTH